MRAKLKTLSDSIKTDLKNGVESIKVVTQVMREETKNNFEKSAIFGGLCKK